MVDCDVVVLPYELDFVDRIPNNLPESLVDTFTRTVAAGGWGTSDSDHIWSPNGGPASDYLVAGGTGQIAISTVNTARRIFAGVSWTDVDITGTSQNVVTPTGGSIEDGAVARWVDSANFVDGRLSRGTTGAVSCAIRQVVAGVETLVGFVAVSGVSATSSISWRLQAVGSLLRFRAWAAGEVEPRTWNVSTTTTWLTAGDVGVQGRLSSTNTNPLPVTVYFDNIYASSYVGGVVASAPQVILSLHTDPWCVTEGTRFDPPTPRYAEVASMLTDGSRYPSVVYNNRVLELRLAVQAAGPDALATQLQTLARQLHFGLDGSGSNILRFSDKTSEPVYFRTFRVSPADLDIITRDQRTALVNVDVPAEPFAFGAREFYTPFILTNNPTTGIANPMYFDLTGVKGDVDTPLTLAAMGSLFETTTVVAVRRRGDPNNMPFALQAELADQLDGSTTLQPFDAAMSGSGSNHTRTNLAAGPGGVLFFDVPDAASVDGRGDYRVIVRLRRSSNTSTIRARASTSGGNLFVYTDWVTVPADTDIQLVDLGVVTVPIGADPIYDGYSGQQIPVFGQNFGIELECTSTPVTGCGTVDLDYVLLTPADDAWLNVRWPTGGVTAADDAIIDGVHEAVWFRNRNALITTDDSAIVGGFPYISPEETNRIVIVAQVGVDATSSSDDISDQHVFVASYWPRYTNPVRPVST